MIRPAAVVALLYIVAGVQGDAETLNIYRQIGLDDDGVLLDRPRSIAWGEDGTTYVLTTGDCGVTVLASDWTVQGRFGRRGEGPGELMNPHDLLVVGGEIWVVQQTRIERFSPTGVFRGTLVMEIGFHHPLAAENMILACADVSDMPGALCVCFDTDGKVLDRFGPSCNQMDAGIRYASCAFWQILPAEGLRCVLLNHLDAEVIGITWAGEVLEPVDLGFHKGSTTRRNHSVNARGVIGPACWDGVGGYFLVVIPEKSRGPDAPGELWHFDTNFKARSRIGLPAGIGGWDLSVSPSGELCIVDSWNCAIHICEMPARGKGQTLRKGPAPQSGEGN